MTITAVNIAGSPYCLLKDGKVAKTYSCHPEE